MMLFFSIMARAFCSSAVIVSVAAESGKCKDNAAFAFCENGPGTWNHTVRANVRLANMIWDHNLLPSLYLSKDDVVLYDTTKPSTVPILSQASIKRSVTKQ